MKGAAAELPIETRDDLTKAQSVAPEASSTSGVLAALRFAVP